MSEQPGMGDHVAAIEDMAEEHGWDVAQKVFTERRDRAMRADRERGMGISELTAKYDVTLAVAHSAIGFRQEG